MDPHLEHDLPSPAPRGIGLPAWLPVRTLGERHRGRVLAHLLSLDDEDRQLRFGHVASDAQIREYAARLDFDRDEVFGIFDARLRLVALAHLAHLAEQPGAEPPADRSASAEFGVSVLRRARGRGFGRRLFELAMLHARNRGARTLVIHLARENAPMASIVRRSGATIAYEGGDAVAHLTLPEDTIGSHMDALLESQAANLDYRLKRQALRLPWLAPFLRPRSARRPQVPRT